MSSTAAAAARGFIVFLFSVHVLQGQDEWIVTCNPTEVCAVTGVTVRILCKYTYPSTIQYSDIKDFWWFRENQSERVALKEDPEFEERVAYPCKENECRLRISHVRESDSAVYKLRIITNQPHLNYTDERGATLTVKDPDLQVKVTTYSSIPEASRLTCFTSCVLPIAVSYLWYENELHMKRQTDSSIVADYNSADNYSCALNTHKNHRSPSVNAPKLPLVSVSPSGYLMKYTKVTLTCNTDANPAANYTWYKESQTLLSEQPQLVFSSLQSNDSGLYHCRAENQLGTRTSEPVYIDVKYAPKLPSVSVSPSGYLMEYTKVTLTCNSDAYPAANYSWYKENQTLLSEQPQLVFSSLQSNDSGLYHCRAENQLGTRTSEPVYIDVKYAPNLTSVSVSPSGYLMEYTKVTLTCNTDANPAANYSWYKENQTLLNEQPQLVFSSLQSNDSGLYHCRAENQLGTRTSEPVYIDVKYNPTKMINIIRFTLMFVILILVLALHLWIRIKERKLLARVEIVE